VYILVNFVLYFYAINVWTEKKRYINCWSYTNSPIYTHSKSTNRVFNNNNNSRRNSHKNKYL